MKTWREANNVWTVSPWFDENKPTILLNAHIDTVKPVSSWTRKPFEPTIEDGTLYGLGSNDCGGGLVSLLQTMRILCRQEQKYNIVYLASAEEEVSGKDGISRAIPLLPHIDVAIVGEPTGMQPAVAKRTDGARPDSTRQERTCGTWRRYQRPVCSTRRPRMDTRLPL